MPRHLSRRQQAIAAYEQGEGTLEEIAVRFRLDAAFLARFLRLPPGQASPASPWGRKGAPCPGPSPESAPTSATPSPPGPRRRGRLPRVAPQGTPSQDGEAEPPRLRPEAERRPREPREGETALARRGRPPRLDEQDLEFLRALTTQQPHASWQDLRAALAERGKPVGPAVLHRALRRLGVKKQRPRPAPEPAPSSPSRPPASPASPPRYRPEHRRVPAGPGAYPSDLTDPEWEQVRPLLERPTGRGRPSTQDRRRILDALFYIGRSGCQWRMLPHDYPPWQTVASCFYRWTRRGVLHRVYASLRGTYREAVGKQEQPSAGIVDSQTVKTTEKGVDRV